MVSARRTAAAAKCAWPGRPARGRLAERIMDSRGRDRDAFRDHRRSSPRRAAGRVDHPAEPVATVYLAARGRGAAMLSTTRTATRLNVARGLLLPATSPGWPAVVHSVLSPCGTGPDPPPRSPSPTGTGGCAGPQPAPSSSGPTWSSSGSLRPTAHTAAPPRGSTVSPALITGWPGQRTGPASRPAGPAGPEHGPAGPGGRLFSRATTRPRPPAHLRTIAGRRRPGRPSPTGSAAAPSATPCRSASVHSQHPLRQWSAASPFHQRPPRTVTTPGIPSSSATPPPPLPVRHRDEKFAPRTAWPPLRTPGQPGGRPLGQFPSPGTPPWPRAAPGRCSFHLGATMAARRRGYGRH